MVLSSSRNDNRSSYEASRTFGLKRQDHQCDQTMSEYKIKPDETTLTLERNETQQPPMYKVLLHNDDYTPMDFVVLILETVFHKPHDDAVKIMLSVHQKGTGVCGVFTHEIAEVKTTKVTELSRQNEYPLMCTMEPE